MSAVRAHGEAATRRRSRVQPARVDGAHVVHGFTRHRFLARAHAVLPADAPVQQRPSVRVSLGVCLWRGDGENY